MNWHDVIIERKTTQGETKKALAAAFEVPLLKVGLFETEEDLLGRELDFHLFGIISTCEGQYSQVLEIFVLKSSLEIKKVGPVIKTFCTELHTTCLVSDESPNLLTRILVTPSEPFRRVFLNDEEYEENDQIFISEKQEEIEKGTLPWLW